MKMELIDKVMQRMMDILDEKQLQELRMALVVDYRITCNNGNQRTLINP